MTNTPLNRPCPAPSRRRVLRHRKSRENTITKRDGLRFTLIVLWFFGMMLLASSAVAALQQTRLIPVTDANWFFSPYSWHVQGADYAETTHPGAYFKIGFTGTSLALNVDASPLKPIQAGLLPRIRWQIDSQAAQEYGVQRSDTVISLSKAALAPGTHSVTVWVVASDPQQDRWTQPPVNVLRVTGLLVDPGATTVPPTLRPARIVFFGDSITEGYDADKNSGNRVNNMNATHAFPYACADSLDAEFGVIGESGQGWMGYAADGVTPALPDAWQWHFQETARLFAPEPDYLVVMEGGNDYLRGADPGALTRSIATWLTQIRAALPDTRIFLLVEFNGFFRDAVTQAFDTYQQASPGDKRTYLIDLGTAGQEGLLTYWDSHGALYTYDGIHPIAARAAVLGQMVAQAIQAAMSK